MKPHPSTTLISVSNSLPPHHLLYSLFGFAGFEWRVGRMGYCDFEIFLGSGSVSSLLRDCWVLLHHVAYSDSLRLPSQVYCRSGGSLPFLDRQLSNQNSAPFKGPCKKKKKKKKKNSYIVPCCTLR
jgi:hypothetical protein